MARPTSSVGLAQVQTVAGSTVTAYENAERLVEEMAQPAVYQDLTCCCGAAGRKVAVHLCRAGQDWAGLDDCLDPSYALASPA